METAVTGWQCIAVKMSDTPAPSAFRHARSWLGLYLMHLPKADELQIKSVGIGNLSTLPSTCIYAIICKV